jgi:quinoprotein glucose dehydrogenase
MADRKWSAALIVAVCLNIVFGVGLLAGGIWLAVLGGSWYYLLAGLALIATGILLAKRKQQALWLYALTLVATVAGSLWEAGSA